MAILDFGKSVWEESLGEALGGIPDLLILEGTWWRERACETRLDHLTSVRELPFPDIFVGSYKGARVAYCCAYGAARAVEPSQIFAQLGTPLTIQIGTCGVLTPGIAAGSVTIPRKARALDGVSQFYGSGDVVEFSPEFSQRADQLLRDAGCQTLDTRHITWPSLFAQSEDMCADWAKEGMQTVDMEATAVAAVAAKYGSACITMLCTWDLLSDGRTFLDPLQPEQQAMLDHANRATFKASLQLAQQIADTR